MFPKHSLESLIAQPHVRRDDSFSPLGAYAGLWKGAFRPDGDGTSGIPFAMRQEGVVAGVHPVLVFPTRAVREVAVRLIEASAAGLSVTFRRPNPMVTQSKVLSAKGSFSPNSKFPR